MVGTVPTRDGNGHELNDAEPVAEVCSSVETTARANALLIAAAPDFAAFVGKWRSRFASGERTPVRLRTLREFEEEASSVLGKLAPLAPCPSCGLPVYAGTECGTCANRKERAR